MLKMWEVNLDIAVHVNPSLTGALGLFLDSKIQINLESHF